MLSRVRKHSSLPGLSNIPCLADKMVEVEIRILGKYQISAY